MISIFGCLLFCMLLFFIGLMGIIINRKNVLTVLLCIELLLLSVSTSFIAFAYYRSDVLGQVFVFFVLAISAVEASIGLAILVTLFRKYSTLDVFSLNKLKD